MTAKSSSGSRRIRLYGFALVKVSLSVDILKQPPKSLNIAVVIGNIRIIHIHPISDPFSKITPLRRVFHHFLTASTVVILHADILSYVLLRNSELLLHAKFHRKSMGIPPGSTPHLISGLCLIPAYCILDRTRHHMMNTWHTIGRRRSFEENEFRCAFPQLQRSLKSRLLLPSFEYLLGHSHEIKSVILFEYHTFLSIFAFSINPQI